MGVACGPGFRYKSSLFPPASPARAVGFSLQSNAAPRTTAKVYFIRHHGFFSGLP